jgi:hypothetical protein
MLEFIGLTAIVYLFIMGLLRLFQGKPPKREIYIIRATGVWKCREFPWERVLKARPKIQAMIENI